MDRTDDAPERYWVLRPFLHYSALELPQPTVIVCSICGDQLMTAEDENKDDTPLLMFKDAPVCTTDAFKVISGHPITPTYMQWLEEGDPRWWSPWFCECEGCEPLKKEE